MLSQATSTRSDFAIEIGANEMSEKWLEVDETGQSFDGFGSIKKSMLSSANDLPLIDFGTCKI